MEVGLLGCVALALYASAETLWVPSIIVDEVVCFFQILMMEEFGCWDDAVR